jgi:DNA-binding transcriptional MerR regulator
VLPGVTPPRGRGSRAGKGPGTREARPDQSRVLLVGRFERLRARSFAPLENAELQDDVAGQEGADLRADFPLTPEPVRGLILDAVSANSKSLRSGELARLTGVSADTIRHYERLEILPKSLRTDGGYRIYSASAVERVRLVQRALQLGFSLAELSEILSAGDNGGVPCHRVLNLTEEKLRSLGRQIQDLRRTQSYMRELVHDWRKKLKQTPAGTKAMLLHSLADKPRLGTKSLANQLKRRSKS